MKKQNKMFSNRSKNQKKLYILLIGLALLSFVIGIIFIFLISNDNKILIKDNLTSYFNNYNSSLELFFKTLFNYFIYIIVIWILGISIIGIPLVLFMYLFKFFVFGFSLSSIINSFGFKGIVISLLDLFPHKFTFLIVLLLVTFYSLSFSIKLIKNLFFKKVINLKEAMSKYFKILIICLSISLIITLYEVFISSFFIKLL